jgi:hypothetical protein
VDNSGNLYIADQGNNVIREVVQGTITTIVGDTNDSYNGDGIAAASAEVNNPAGVGVDRSGNLYIADTDNERIREVTGLTGLVSLPQTAVASASAAQNVMLAINSNLTISAISVPQSYGAVQEYSVGAISGCVADGVTNNADGTICTVPATFQPGYPGVRQIPLAVQTSAGLFQFALQGTGVAPLLAFGPGIISTYAGSGTAAYGGDGGAATSAQLNQPFNTAIDAAGNLYIADELNSMVRKVTPGGTITTVAGTGTTAYGGDGGAATSAELDLPFGVAVDGAGNLYVADTGNQRVRKVTPGGTITTVAGTGTGGYNGDSITATSAELYSPEAVAVDSAGNLYIADNGNQRVRKVTSGGTITTVAGTGTAGYNGDNIAATSAELNSPTGVSVSGAGNLYIADESNSRIRMVTPAGIITTVAGNGTAGYSGDNIAATGAELNNPTGVALDGAGNLYIADEGNSRIRKVTPSGTITTVAGTGIAGYNGDNITATTAELYVPTGVALDAAGNLYIADDANNRVRKVDLSDPPSFTFAGTNVGSASTSQDVSLLNLGNTPLDITQISTATNFSLGGSDTSCNSSGQLLNPATNCVLGIELYPATNGNLSGNITLTDNSLNAAPATQAIALQGIGVASQSITFPNPGTVINGVAPITLTATASSNLPVTYSVTSGPATVNGSVLTITGPGTVNVQASQPGNFEYSSATASVTFTVLATQTIAFPNPGTQTYGVSAITLTATTTSPLMISYSVISGPATVSGNSLTITGAGTVKVQASQPGDGVTWAAATPVNQAFTVLQNAPTVTFTGAPTSAAYLSTFSIAATTNATSTPSFTVVSGPCTISSTTVTITAPSGTCSLKAAWAADANYVAAIASQSTSATRATPIITWTTPAAITYGTKLSATQLNARATYNGAVVTGTLTYSPLSGTTLTAGPQTLSVTFAPKSNTDYMPPPTPTTVTLQVNPATPKITWKRPSSIPYGIPLSATQLDATLSVPDTITPCVYTPPATTVLTGGSNTLSVTCTPDDTVDYTTATATTTITVDKVAPTVVWATHAPIPYGTKLSATQLDATSPIGGTFAYVPAAGKVLAGGNQTLSVTFTPDTADATNYTTAKATVIQQVTRATPTITWATPTAITYGTLLKATQLDAKATFNGVAVAGTFEYSPGLGTALNAGLQTLSVTFTPTNTADFNAPAGSTVTLQVNPATPKITWATPAPITNGTALSSTQLDATTPVPGTFTYSPPAGTVLPNGIQTLTVNFTPTDTTDYLTPAAVTVKIKVNAE